MSDIAFFEKDLDECSLLEGAVALISQVYPDTDKQWIMLTLDAMFNELEHALVHEQNQKQKFESFIRHFYHEWGFSGDTDAFFSPQNTRIDLVIQRRKGIPVSLGALLLYFGERLGFPIEGVVFPSQFIVKITWNNEPALFLNPFNGEYVSKSILRAWLIGQDGPLAKLTPRDLAAADNPTVLGRWLAVIKTSLLAENNFTLALKCTDIALSFIPDDPYEIRDRGFIYQQLDCHQMAADDFQFFIDNCPEDPASEMLKLQVSALSGHQPIIH